LHRPRFVTCKFVALLCGLSRAHVYELVSGGVLPVRGEGRRRVALADVETMLGRVIGDDAFDGATRRYEDWCARQRASKRRQRAGTRNLNSTLEAL
jgi:hypothetical protein